MLDLPLVFIQPNSADKDQSFKKNNFDLCILDVMMPKLDGFSLAEQIRKVNKDIPLIFLTAKSMLYFTAGTESINMRVYALLGLLYISELEAISSNRPSFITAT